VLQGELRKLLWLFLVPSLILYLIVGLWPNIEALYWGLTEYDGISLTKTFVGLQNFRYMLADDRWSGAVGNTFYFALGSMVTLMPSGLLFAVLIMGLRRGHGFFKTAVYIPSVLSVVIIALLWVFVLEPTIGLVNQVLKSWDLVAPLKGLLGVSSLNWLGHPKLAKPSIVVIQQWQGLGFYTLLFMAGLAKIPRELCDAARIDGADGWSLFRHITWPLLFPTTRTVLLLLIINGLQIFTLIYALGGGGSGVGSPMTQVMATYIYRVAFTEHRFGYATALSSSLMVLIAVLTLISRRVTRREAIQY
jgi:ABC-type sugar transport system permease subunit